MRYIISPFAEHTDLIGLILANPHYSEAMKGKKLYYICFIDGKLNAERIIH